MSLTSYATKLFDVKNEKEKPKKLINLQYIELRCYFSSTYVPRLKKVFFIIKVCDTCTVEHMIVSSSILHMYMIYLIKESDLFLLTGFYLGQIRCSSSYLGLTISRYPCPVKEVQHHECREFR